MPAWNRVDARMDVSNHATKISLRAGAQDSWSSWGGISCCSKQLLLKHRHDLIFIEASSFMYTKRSHPYLGDFHSIGRKVKRLGIWYPTDIIQSISMYVRIPFASLSRPSKFSFHVSFIGNFSQISFRLTIPRPTEAICHILDVRARLPACLPVCLPVCACVIALFGRPRACLVRLRRQERIRAAGHFTGRTDGGCPARSRARERFSSFQTDFDNRLCPTAPTFAVTASPRSAAATAHTTAWNSKTTRSASFSPFHFWRRLSSHSADRAVQFAVAHRARQFDLGRHSDLLTT